MLINSTFKGNAKERQAVAELLEPFHDAGLTASVTRELPNEKGRLIVTVLATETMPSSTWFVDKTGKVVPDGPLNPLDIDSKTHKHHGNRPASDLRPVK